MSEPQIIIEHHKPKNNHRYNVLESDGKLVDVPAPAEEKAEKKQDKKADKKQDIKPVIKVAGEILVDDEQDTPEQA